jgi:conjugal transfer pilus assembly protein TraD
MTPAAHSRRPRRYWLLIVFALLMVAPAAWAIGAMSAALAIGLVAGAADAAKRRRGRAAEWAGAERETLIGRDRAGAPVALADDQLSAHGLILGASGAGKSTTLLAILAQNIERGRPVIAIDMKGSPAFARALASAAASAGRSFRLWTLEGPGHWNPLRHGDATELKDKLIATERFTEPHYQRAAERYMQLTLQVLQELHPDQPVTLDEVVRSMDPRRLAPLLRGLPRARAARIHDYLATLTPDQLSAVRGLETRLAIISESRTGQFLSPQRSEDRMSIDLRTAFAGRDVVLFSLNSSTYGKLAAQIGTLVVQDLITAVGHRLSHQPEGAQHLQAIVAVDEFSALGAENVIALLARSREPGVSMLLATQELADLDRAAPGLRDQVLGNTAVKIAHRQDVPASAQTIAQMAGTVKRWEETRQYGGGLLGGLETGRGTRREVEQFVVHPNEIKTLRTGEAVMIVKQPRAAVKTVRVAPRQPRVAPPPPRVAPPREGSRDGQTPPSRDGQTPHDRDGTRDMFSGR